MSFQGARGARRLASSAAASRYQREWFAGLAPRVAAGEPLVLADADVPHELLRAMDIPYVVNQWWASICSAKQRGPDYLRAPARARLSRLGRAVLGDRARLDARARPGRGALGRPARRLAVPDPDLDRLASRDRAGLAARARRAVLRAREGGRAGAAGALVGADPLELGRGRRHGAARPDDRRARADGRLPRGRDRASVRAGTARGGARARERAAGVEPKARATCSPPPPPRRSTSSTASPP